MSDWIDRAPADFAQLAEYVPSGVLVSDRIITPVVIIERAGNAFVTRLAGRRTLRGETITSPAPSTGHNWVLDGDTVRPLPADTPAAIESLIGANSEAPLSFGQVVALLSKPSELILLEAAESVLSPARNQAETLDGTISVPGLHATLFPYQARGVRWMRDVVSHTGGVILADEMGLGKTIQIISLLLDKPPEDEAPALVVCPTSLIANWRREILKFAPTLSVLIHRGAQRTGVAAGLQRSQIVITTYDTLVNDISLFRSIEWSWLICDEAQALKNPDAQRRIALASVPRRLTIPMTGTPVETSLRDLWSLTDLAIPGLLGGRTEFETHFPDDEASAHRLAEITAPIVLRRRVADVADDLPERIDIDVPLELGPDLAERYQQVLADTLQKYPTAGALVATGQLQLFCSHPWLQGGGAADDGEASLARNVGVPLLTPKLERTVDLLREAFLSGEKVLLFALFNRCGDLVREAARDLSDGYWGAINGSTPERDRQKIVDDFTAWDGPGCLILNPKAAGTGLNITAATIVIHYTQVWNPALEAQASARAHRRGQTKPVRIYRLYYENTVEKVMIERSEWRRELGNDAVPISTREHEDLRRALSFHPENAE